jgi:hypothetical protein
MGYSDLLTFAQDANMSSCGGSHEMRKISARFTRNTENAIFESKGGSHQTSKIPDCTHGSLEVQKVTASGGSQEAPKSEPMNVH